MPSPFVPSHKRRFTANKVFTDREKPVALFLHAFDPPPPVDRGPWNGTSWTVSPPRSRARSPNHPRASAYAWAARV